MEALLEKESRSQAWSEGDTAICTVTAMEIEYGSVLNPARSRKIEPMIRSLLEDLQVFSYEPEDATAKAAGRAALAKRVNPSVPTMSNMCA